MDVRRVLFGVIGVALSATVASAQPWIAVNGALSPNPVSTPAGSVATVAISNGPGNATDWIALYPIAAADTAYLDWKYLSGSTAPPSSGLTNATIQELLPVTPGDYEIRLFASNGYQLLATSPTITVSATTTAITINGVAPPSVVTVSAGAMLSLGVTDDPGNATDWIALYPAGAADSAYIDWRYLNGTVVPPASGATSGTLAFPAPTMAGGFEFRVFANNGFERLTTRAFVVQSSTAQITVNGVAPPSVATAAAGTDAVVDLAASPGNATDWVGFFSVGATDAQYLAWQYLNGSTSAPTIGLITTSLRFLLPTAPGNYEFRLFVNNTNQLLSTSATVTIAAPTAQIAVNGVAAPGAVTAPAGSVATASISGGPANATDWVGLYRAGSADTASLDWRYLNGTTQVPATGSATGVVTFTLAVIAGDYEIRFFANNTYARLATSSAIAVPAPTAQIAVNGTPAPNAVTAVAGANLSVAVSGDPANPTDWVALAPVGSSEGTYLGWQYLNGLLTPPTEGLSAATLNFAAPALVGDYEFRLFVNNTYERLATSGAVSTMATACSYTVSPASITSDAGGLTGTIAVSVGSTCGWTANSNQSWVSVPPSTSTGNGAVTYAIAANSGTSARTATLMVAGVPVAVTQTGVVPTVSIAVNGPYQGMVFVAPSALTIHVAATATNGSIAKIDVFAGAILLGTVTTAPYQLTWPSPATGSYALTAVATDNLGGTTASAPVAISVRETALRPTSSIVDSTNPLSTNLTGLFLMNEGSGTTDSNIVDGQSATFAGPSLPTWNTADPSVVFGGGISANSYLDAGTDLAFDRLPVTAVTLVAKVYVTTLAVGGVASKNNGSGGNSGFVFGWNNSGALKLTVEKSTSHMRVTSTTGAIQAGQWIQVAFTWDGAVGNAAAAHLFVNGIEVSKASSADGSGTIGYTNATNQPFRIGTASFDVSGSLKGRVAYLAVYRDRILTPSELRALDAQLPINPAGAPTVSVALTSPPAGVTFTGAPTVGVTANASVTEGSIARVEFLAGVDVFDTVTSPPYQTTWRPVLPASYQLTARAVSDSGARATSAAVSVTINSLGTLTAPTISPASGAYAFGQPISLSGASGATLRYTTNGSAPTATSTLYAGPLTLNDNMTIKVQAFEDGWTPSAVSTVVYTIPPRITVNGVSAPNGVSVDGGATVSVHVSGPGNPGDWVALAQAGSADGTYVSFKYLNGLTSPPSQGLVSATLSFAMAATVGGTYEFRLFAANTGARLATSGAVHTIDSTGPVITPTYNPAPTAAGWNNGPVIVSFTCADAASGVASCPAPVSFSSEGQGQSVSVTATDGVGNQRTVTISVSIDLTAPVLAVVQPSSGATVAESSVALSGTVADTLSGMDRMSCNQAPVAVVNGAWSCTALLHDGMNIVLLQSVDRAGNSASRGVQIIRTAVASAITVVPAERALTVGETLQLNAFDNLGMPVNSTSWSTDDSSVAAVSVDGVMTAVGVGATAITVTSGTLSARMQVTVFGSGAMPVGTTRWLVNPVMDGYQTVAMSAVSDLGATSFAEIEVLSDPNTGDRLNTIVRGLTSTGEQTYAINVPLSADESVAQTIGDPEGGVVLVVDKNFRRDAPVRRALVRVSASADASGWRHEFDQGVGGVAQGPDGTIFVITGSIVNGLPIVGNVLGSTRVVGLDGLTGNQRLEMLAPTSWLRRRYGLTDGTTSCSSFNDDFAFPGQVQGVRVDASGAANVIVPVLDQTVSYQTSGSVCPSSVAYFTFVSTTARVAGTVSLARISSSGAGDVVLLHDYTGANAFENTSYFGVDAAVLPDGEGGVLAWWQIGNHAGTGDLSANTHARYVIGSTTGPEFAADYPVLSASGQIAYTTSNRGGGPTPSVTKAINMIDGTVVWSASTQGAPSVALEGGRVAVGDVILDADGSTLATGQPTFLTSSSVGSFTYSVYDSSPVNLTADGAVGLTTVGFNGPPDPRPAMRSTYTAFVDSDAAFAFFGGGPTNRNAPADYNSNYNSIELITSAPAVFVWDLVRGFTGVDNGDVASVSISPTRPVSGVGDTIQFSFKNPLLALGQPPFSVMITRFDAAATTLAAVTLPDHPLSGSRYWRVFESLPGHLVIETGAVDKPRFGIGNWLGFRITKHQQLKIWEQELQFIANSVSDSLYGGEEGITPFYNIIHGRWDVVPKRYLMTQICGHPPVASGFCQ
jgi:hypothetical protein